MAVDIALVPELLAGSTDQESCRRNVLAYMLTPATRLGRAGRTSYTAAPARSCTVDRIPTRHASRQTGAWTW